jgi:hypothetical protein
LPAWQVSLLTTNLLLLLPTEDGGLWTFGINNHGQLVRTSY